MKVFKKLFSNLLNKDCKMTESQADCLENIKLPCKLTKKMEMLKPHIIKNKDIVTRSFYIDKDKDLQVTVIYIVGLIDTNILNRDVLKRLMMSYNRKKMKKEGTKLLIDQISRTLLSVGQVKKVDTFADLLQKIFDGLTIIMFDGLSEVLSIDIRGGQERDISEPTRENTLRGCREGFVENIDVNIALVRRKIRDPKLVVEKTIVGRRGRTDVAFLYIEDIADPRIVKEVKERVAKIDIDGRVCAGSIEQWIEDSPYSFFPQILATERPDKVAAQLLEGRVAIISNGTPSVLILPSLFVQFLQSPDDYFERTYIGSFTRGLRYIAFFLAVSLPAIYVALLGFQQELIPFNLIVSLAESRKEVPFPVAVEAIIQELIIQLIIETGLRLPTPLGQTVGVVGGIVLGQAAITAKLASPAMVIITAVTTICTFAMATSSISMATRILRLPMLILASTLGLFGFSLGWLIIFAHLVSLESVGVPYFAPFAPMRFADLKDSFYRNFTWKMENRPVSIPNINKKRQGKKDRKDKK
ncbi:MAG: spore germination protein [Clostridia bacterium]|nr:spore germination protein [Clostridia bacterium]